MNVLSKNGDVRHTAPSTIDGVEFKDYAPAAIPGPGTAFLGRMVELTRSEIGWDFGQGMQYPLVLTFEAVSGSACDKDGLIFDLLPGQNYGLWLIHTVILNKMKEAKLTPGELFAVRGNGEKLKRGMNPGDKNSTYVDYSIAFPEREQQSKAVNWDDV